MAFLDKLKAIGLNFPKLRSISLFKLSVVIDRSVHVDKASATVTINPDELTGKQRRALKRIMQVEALEEAGAIIYEKALPEVEEVRALLPSMEPTVEYFRNLIPPEDIPLLRACLYLRARHLKNLPVDREKTDILQAYGPRGGNLANLCSAGYLEEWFKPLHEQLQKDYPDNPALVKEKFQAHYRTILADLPWTVFVSRAHKAKKVPEVIIDKMRRNLDSGTRHLNVHGLGADNVKRIASAIPEIQEKLGAVAVHMERDPAGARIFVRLEIPLQLAEPHV